MAAPRKPSKMPRTGKAQVDPKKKKTAGMSLAQKLKERTRKLNEAAGN